MDDNTLEEFKGQLLVAQNKVQDLHGERERKFIDFS